MVLMHNFKAIGLRHSCNKRWRSNCWWADRTTNDATVTLTIMNNTWPIITL